MRASFHPHRKRLPLLAGGSFFGLSTAGAQAHTIFQGLGELGSGFLHPYTTLPHILLLAALGLWLGQRTPLRLKAPVAIFAACAALALALTPVGLLSGVPAPVLIALSLGVGTAVALAMPPPPALQLVIFGAAALALGLDSGTDPGTTGFAQAKALFATWVSLVLCVVNVSFYVSLLPPLKWVQTGLRIAGSWIVAIAFLMLAFALRRPR